MPAPRPMADHVEGDVDIQGPGVAQEQVDNPAGEVSHKG